MPLRPRAEEMAFEIVEVSSVVVLVRGEYGGIQERFRTNEQLGKNAVEGGTAA
jgi:hypothetical protein